MRLWCPFLLLGLFLVVSCQPLSEPPNLEGLVELKEIPAEYGQLVAVTAGPLPERWYGLWFSNAESGRVTYMSVSRDTWQYRPDSVKVLERKK